MTDDPCEDTMTQQWRQKPPRAKEAAMPPPSTTLLGRYISNAEEAYK